ncbi:MAG: exosome complex RNA-binding protein Rrp4 [Candidatus Methanoperedens sp.]|jgi:exosome complex component RRP4|nr:exosome complex RNA-binding protein Rrp4 [Candidatus Methanoperedens sp.]PKL53946.1 MAG: RNA-binding protein [Candidatus Methanoperedenaceae archaeon HGW-Methanoperedenaceae-1]
MDKKIVIPGDFLSDDVKNATDGTYVEDGKVFAAVYGLASLKNQIRVVPLSGKYIPKRGDMVIATVSEVTFSNWITDIRSPYDGLLHISEFPKRIENDDMAKHINVGESVMALIKDVDPIMKVELTLNDRRLRRIDEGRIIQVAPSKVPRLIGRNGSMITLLKNNTNCNVFVGQNGRIWITGKERDMDFAEKIIFKIENESHVSGLTERINRFIKEEKGESAREPEYEQEPEIEEEDIETDKTVEKTEDIPVEEETQEEDAPEGILDELLGDGK